MCLVKVCIVGLVHCVPYLQLRNSALEGGVKQILYGAVLVLFANLRLVRVRMIGIYGVGMRVQFQQ